SVTITHRKTPLFSRMVVFWVMLSYRKKRGLSIFLRDRVYTKYFTLSNRYLKRLRILKQTTCHPFLLHVFDDYDKHVIDEATVERTLHFILSYLLRRMACGVPSNGLRGFFIYLYNRIFKVPSNKKKYYEAINKFMFTVSSKDVIPPAAEFERALEKSNIYGNNALCRFLLLDIENGDGKEILEAEALTIEHIMPQTLTADWNYIRSEDHEEYVHRLGNLSVTGYNSELSNKSFAEKKEIIRENSKAVVLNSDILNKNSWDIADIQARSKRLAEVILERYKIDRIADESIEFEYIETLTLDNYDEVTGKKLVSFKLFGETYRQNKYALMLLDVLRLLDKKDPVKMQRLAESNYSFNATKRKHTHLNLDGSGMRGPWKVREGIYYESNLSSWSCIRFIEKLLAEFGFEKDQFSFNIMAEETTDIDEDED
ncbi:MAG: HNH endonuclease family protein, partial [Pyramidobacter sp.]|nr:HNH endonuclease family protein [Pyramidobacter sp.]